MTISYSNFELHYSPGVSHWLQSGSSGTPPGSLFASKVTHNSFTPVQAPPGPAAAEPQVKHASVRLVLTDGRAFRWEITGPCEGGVEVDSPDPYHYPVVSGAGNPVILPHNPVMTAVFRFKRNTGVSGPFVRITEEQAELDFGDDGIQK